MSQSGVASDAGAMRVVQLFGFATGGVGHVASLGSPFWREFRFRASWVA